MSVQENLLEISKSLENLEEIIKFMQIKHI